MNAEIVALRVKLYNVERDLEDSKADYVKLAHLVCDLWHSSAAAYIPPWLQKRVRDVSHAQLAEAQRFPHGAAAVTGCDMKINDEGRSNAAYWHERAMKAEARLAEAVECCTIKDNRNLRLEAKVADLERQLHWALTGDMPTDSAEGGAK